MTGGRVVAWAEVGAPRSAAVPALLKPTGGGGCRGSPLARVAAFAVGFGGLLVGSAWLLVKAFGAPHTRERRARRWWYAVGSLACLGVVGWVYFSPASPL